MIFMLSKRNVCVALTALLAMMPLVAGDALASPAKAVMPVSASWGREQSMLRAHSDNSGRQLAMAPAKLPKAEVAPNGANERQMAEFADAVTVTARQMTREGSKQIAQITKWLAIIWKQNFTTPTMRPAVDPVISQTDLQSYRGQSMRSVSSKHPLWLLSDGRMKTVTSH